MDVHKDLRQEEYYMKCKWQRFNYRIGNRNKIGLEIKATSISEVNSNANFMFTGNLKASDLGSP